MPSQGVEAFDIVTSIGASVVTSAYLICLWIIEQGYFNGPFDDAEKARLSPLASIVLSIMNINAVYEPFKDVKDAVFKSNKGKIEASQRPRPTILSYYYSYSRVATDILHQKKSRKTRTELVMDQVQQHNVQEKVRSSKSPRAAKPASERKRERERERGGSRCDGARAVAQARERDREREGEREGGPRA